MSHLSFLTHFLVFFQESFNCVSRRRQLPALSHIDSQLDFSLENNGSFVIEIRTYGIIAVSVLSTESLCISRRIVEGFLKVFEILFWLCCVCLILNV